MSKDEILAIAEIAASIALEKAGVSNGEMSCTEAKRVYGSFFREAVREGRIRPCRQGLGKTGKAGKKYFRVADILALRAELVQRANIQLREINQ